MPVPAGIHEAGRRVDEEAEPAQGALAVQPRDEVVWQPDSLQRRAEDELSRMEDESPVLGDLDQLGEVLLFLPDVDERISVVVENPEIAVDPDVHARGLQELVVVGIDLDAAFREKAGNRPVGEHHRGDSMGCPWRLLRPVRFPDLVLDPPAR